MLWAPKTKTALPNVPAGQDVLTPPTQYEPAGQLLHTVVNADPDIVSYPSAHTIPVTETLSINDVQSSPAAQLPLAAFWNLIVTDPVEPPWHHALLVTVIHWVLSGTWL